MLKILRQLQNDLKEVSILLLTDEWFKGYITYVDEECVSFEANERDGVFYTSVIKLEAILAVEFVSDVRISSHEKYALPDERDKKSFDTYGDNYDDYA